ncbi:hypothetical protein BJ875DRAFT_467889 [Amylocarpus encephaloides]|uniref:Uncharacterized protein n=1 Tax=Amylocarpus encephaloides TaxID=45428 RepID=A0A9P7YEA8_9HELO|nr:hypothetical protein BJ875DRAFT_467889 [Amylocarpus encephaloides]
MMEAPDSPPHGSTQAQFVAQSKSVQSNSSAARANGEGNSKANFGSPGSSWSTKKFNEEYQRAYDAQTDKDWDVTKYGDPLLENSGS